MTKKRHDLDGYYRKGKVYFRAVYVKSRNLLRVYWLNPVGELPASRRYSVETLDGARRLKTKPSKRTLTEAWLIK